MTGKKGEAVKVAPGILSLNRPGAVKGARESIFVDGRVRPGTSGGILARIRDPGERDGGYFVGSPTKL